MADQTSTFPAVPLIRRFDRTRDGRRIAYASALGKLKAAHPDIEITEAFNFVDPVQENFDGSMMLLYEGAILAVIVVWFFLRDWRATLVAATALPLWGVTIALNFADWYGLTVVTAQLGLAEAGIYRVVMQFATVFSLLSTGLFGVYSVRIGAAQANADWAAVARLVRSATLLSAALVTIPAIILIIAAKPVLGIVGPEFQSGAAALQIGLVGQILYIITGPAGLTLAMTGHARINLAITLISTASLIVFAPLAAAKFGIIGVVGCVSALLVARNLASLAFVRRLLGINALSGRYHPPA